MCVISSEYLAGCHDDFSTANPKSAKSPAIAIRSTSLPNPCEACLCHPALDFSCDQVFSITYDNLHLMEGGNSGIPTARAFAVRYTLVLSVLALVVVSVSSCGKKPTPSLPPMPPDFTQALQYAQRAALAYEQDATIQQQSGTGVRISISAPLSSGIKAYVELDDTKRVQWIVVRGTSNLLNIRSDVDYNKAVESRLQIPLHKGFADAALQVYRFAKPLLKTDYETRVTGHSYGGHAESSSSCG